MNVTQIFMIVLGGVENFKGKGEHVCYQHFPYSYVFKSLFPQSLSKWGLCGTELMHLLTIPKLQILGFSKLKEFADNIVKFDKNGRNFFRRLENTVGKAEIAHYGKLLLFP